MQIQWFAACAMTCILCLCTGSMLCRFFRYFFLLFLMHYMSVTMFRAIGGIARNLVVANACGSLGLLCILLLGGFVLAKRELCSLTDLPYHRWSCGCRRHTPLLFTMTSYLMNGWWRCWCWCCPLVCFECGC